MNSMVRNYLERYGKIALGCLGVGVMSLILAFGGGVSAQVSNGSSGEVSATINGTSTLDHFKCYELERGNTVLDLVFLLDQFGIRDQYYERDIVGGSRIFCNPTRKIHGTSSTGIQNLMNHLTWYDLKPVFPRKFEERAVMVWNQFAPNGERLLVKEPKFLAVPTHKATVDGIEQNLPVPENLDHFKCYDVKGEKIEAQAQLQDQFDRMPPGNENTFENVRVKRPEYLCNPTYKAHFTGWNQAHAPQWNVTTIQHPEDHLVCYSLDDTKKMVKNVVGHNQFGEEQMRTKEPKLLCVPSTKQVITAPGEVIE